MKIFASCTQILGLLAILVGAAMFSLAAAVLVVGIELVLVGLVLERS